jgi:hypothetical protein
LAYLNNYTVTPGGSLPVQVGIGGSPGNLGGSGAGGAVRIIWPGNIKTFPSSAT